MLRTITKGVLLGILAGAITACTSSSNEESVAVDEVHRPTDYTAKMTMLLHADMKDDGREYHAILSSQGDDDFDVLLSQLWKLAFSGDSKVFGVDYLGQLDENMPLDPEKLVQALSSLDTVWIEDLLTGEMKDSILEFNFTEKDVSALSIYFKCGNDFDPYAVGFGKQVFNEETGAYRGISNKFFIKLNADTEESVCVQRLAIQSDSVGVMRPAFFDFYFDHSETPFQNAMTQTNDSTFAIDLEIGLLSKENKMILIANTSEKEEAL